MQDFRKGDIVARRSYRKDLLFKVVELYQGEDGREYALLKGIDYRLVCDAPLEDLVKVGVEEVAAHWRKVFLQRAELLQRYLAEGEEPSFFSRLKAEPFPLPGRVLHLDGDADYLGLCLATYRQLAVPTYGYAVPEKEQAQALKELFPRHLPDILVLTGHDGLKGEKPNFKDLGSYRHSYHFVEAVKVARSFVPDRDALVIVAGACQSHYEALLEAGANFASSPQRVLIHAFDPVFVAARVAFTPVDKLVSLKKVIEGTVTGYAGIGGIVTRGRFRQGIPKSPY
ncbi:sporulation peptidase YabG [Ammonifex degensii KC4]|uniref:Sporulation peptidase YabG n=1 Tax=Ammonifex degensii (strain DSM 10501 / KC4) TaxID=429009 RepID=C9RA56_AMMDK|nr:sporulation peptidase YabG [Ammonifex degensii]ACX53185.1 sporulation peptidase YabG [Ammonifex degensii KC4]